MGQPDLCPLFEWECSDWCQILSWKVLKSQDFYYIATVIDGRKRRGDSIGKFTYT